MGLEDWANLGEAIGGMGVVISLIYLAIQVQSNTRTVSSASNWDANHTFAELNDRIWQDSQFSELLRRSMEADPGDFDEAEQFRLHVFARGLFQRLEARYILHKRGLLEQEIYENGRKWQGGLIRNVPWWKDWWDVESTGNSIFTQGFISEMNSVEPDTVQFLGVKQQR